MSSRSRATSSSAYTSPRHSISSLRGLTPPVLKCGCDDAVVAWTSKTKSNPSRRFVKCAKRVVCKVWFWEDLIHQYVDDLVDYFIDAKTQLIEESNQTLQVQVDEKTNLLLKLQDDILTAYGQLEEETSKLRQSEEQRQILQSRVTAIERKCRTLVGFVVMLIILFAAKHY